MAQKKECIFCEKQCKSRDDLNYHQRSHVKEKPFWCPLCSTEFNSGSSMINHLQIHTGEKPFKCNRDGCPSSYPSKASLAYHIKTAHGKGLSIDKAALSSQRSATVDTSAPIRCEHCQKPCSSKKTLCRHMQVAHGDQFAFQCNICGKGFSCGLWFTRHQDVHGQGPLSCSICGNQYKSKSALADHLKVTHSNTEPSFNCTICSKTFPLSRTLQRHMKTVHSGDRPFQCHLCDYRSSQNSSLKRHLNGHANKDKEPQKQCSLCERRFHTEAAMRDHFKIHTNERPYKCPMCPKAFKDARCLKRHKRLRHESTKVGCVFCKFLFADDKKWNVHILQHTREMSYPCKYCSKRFSSIAAVKNHKKAAHAPNIGQFPCDQCSKILLSMSGLKNHLHRQHNPNKKPPAVVDCLFCGKDFTKQKCRLADHINTHTKEKPYECTICSKGFACFANMKSHLQLHTGELPFKCPMLGCDKRFRIERCSRKHYLNVHQLHRQNQSNPDKKSNAYYDCLFCGKDFTKHKCQLADHINTHTDEKPYECPICSQGFAYRSNMISHLQCHTGERHFNCPYLGCKMSFRRRQNAREHYLKTHKI